MNLWRLKVLPAGALLALAAVVALPPEARAANLRVLAAASLQDAFHWLGARFEAAHPGVRLEFDFAGSQVLRTQIEQGAQGDLFASADTEHVAALAREGLAEPPAIFAHNRVVVVTPTKEKRVRRLADLGRPGLRIVMAGPTVPAGRYAEQVLVLLGRDPSLGKALETATRANVVSQESNVRAVLAKVQLGEADAGFVYETDARAAAGRVRVIRLPERIDVQTTYAVALLRGSSARGAALAFQTFLLGPEARVILRGLGFRP
jgi:molybdate transport system substrate-binding protein